MADYSGDPSEFKVYWFARDLVASSFGGYATSEVDTLKELSTHLEDQLDDDELLSESDLEVENDTSRTPSLAQSTERTGTISRSGTDKRRT